MNKIIPRLEKPEIYSHFIVDYGLDGWGLIPNRSKKFFSSPQCPDQPWDPPSLLSIGYQGLFPQE
jgi:hypothetical protein